MSFKSVVRTFPLLVDLLLKDSALVLFLIYSMPFQISEEE